VVLGVVVVPVAGAAAGCWVAATTGWSLAEAAFSAAQAQAENMLTGTLRSLFAVVENYPTLKANENVLSLQEQLTTTENQIGFARQHYNATVLDFNTGIATFPAVLLAGPLGFAKREFFEAEQGSTEVPKVQF